MALATGLLMTVATNLDGPTIMLRKQSPRPLGRELEGERSNCPYAPIPVRVVLIR